MGAINEFRTVVDFDPAGFEPMNLLGLPDQDVLWRNISFDQKTGMGSYLMIMAPGTKCNPHRHNGAEEFYIVEGDLADHDGHLYTAGQFISLAPGSEHFSVTPSGCKLVVTQRGTTTEYLHGEWEAPS
ncbi:ChrR Cupin-like domain protein [Roseovarius litorisediminis]|uniref:ChrR Cupin-like domain protein n=1 Tax=Roseovarius litorisediminis TaxID=1312363 RepID=A0A1Y5RNQ1_9RHOB|nr:cupin domain-containing protein [Roseovarius litorisediminis]SLN20624.1 ChrR Cupin-like domain protein [Roseovarius litorisediminis]